MMTEQLRCARHPNEETNLRCGRCEKPICVRCMRYTSVGLRCRECAVERRSGVNAPAAGQLLRAAGAGLGVALVVGALWGLFPAYGFWAAMLLGFGGGELISLAARRGRGPELMSVAAVSVIAAFLVGLSFGGFSPSIVFHSLMAALALYLAVVRQR